MSLLNFLLSTTGGIAGNNAKVLIITGQSNGQGRGDNIDLPNTDPIDGVNIFAHSAGNQTVGYTTSNKAFFDWRTLQAGVNNKPVYQNNADEHGVEIYLASLLKNIYESNIYIIKYARGGTSISAWTPKVNFMYSEMLDMISDALPAIPEPYDILPIYWDQIENNVGSTSYAVSCLQLYSDWRNDIKADIPVIARRISVNQVAYPAPDIATSQAQQQIVDSDNVINHLIDSDDLTFPDNIHLGSQGLSIMADRYISLL